MKETYSLLVRSPEQTLWTHFRQEVHSKDIPLHVTLQLQTPQGYEGPGLGHCPDRSRRRVMRGEEWRLPGGRRSCGSTELRPWEKIEKLVGREGSGNTLRLTPGGILRASTLSLSVPLVDPSCSRHLGRPEVALEIVADSRSSSVPSSSSAAESKPQQGAVARQGRGE